MRPRSFAALASVFALGLAACATPRPRPQTSAPSAKPPSPVVQAPSAAPTPSPPTPAAPQSPCFNSQYKFTCAIPQGFVITQEGEGPGEIMTLVPQSLTSNSTANLIIRTAPLGRSSLDSYVSSHVTGGLDGAPGMKHWDKFPATFGPYSGIEVDIEREYANGPFRSRVFVFTRGNNAFVLNYSASSDQFDRYDKIIDQFLQSMSFAPS